jgi:hypothetical protein
MKIKHEEGNIYSNNSLGFIGRIEDAERFARERELGEVEILREDNSDKFDISREII